VKEPDKTTALEDRKERGTKTDRKGGTSNENKAVENMPRRTRREGRTKKGGKRKGRSRKDVRGRASGEERQGKDN
jgi:hypothetical protein